MHANDSFSEREALSAEIENLRARLQEAEDTLQAIRKGEVDALLVEGPTGEQVFTLRGADHGYRILVETMGDGALTVQPDGMIYYANARFAAFLQLPLEKIVGSRFQQFLRQEQMAEFDELLRQEGNRRGEFELFSAEGRCLPIQVGMNTGPQDDSLGTICLIVTDLTDQKHFLELQQAQEALQESEQQLRLALETARLGSWRLDLSTNEIICSKQCKANFGFVDGQQVTYELLNSVICDDDRPRMRKAVETAMANRTIYECEYRINRRDGTQGWIIASGRAVYRDDGTPIQMIGVTLDITERKQIEESLRESEGRFRTLAEAIPQLSWTCRPDGQCDYLSQQWFDYTGIPMDGQLGSGWVKNVHSDDHDQAMSAWRKSFEEGIDYDVEYRLRGKNGAYRWFKARGIPVRDAEGKIVKWFGTSTDIEDIVQAREVLAQNRAELESLVQERTAQLEETTGQLNNFCYSIAHDLRAPLRAQNAYARILVEDFGTSLGETGQDYAHRIINAAEKLDRLVQDLLSHVSLSRTDLPLEKVEMSTAITQVRADFSEEIHKVHAKVAMGSIEGIVLAHEPSLNLIIANLLSNALKYCKPGVPPAIAIRTDNRPDGMLRLWIEDEGIGIKPEYHERIFGVFQRLHTADTYPGTGIGLALVRKGLERMGGHVGVESELGKGSRFWIDLRVAE
jgi:PAS domain S-box-containing protein